MIHEETDNTPDIIKEDPVEEEILVTLRPTSLSEYIGQDSQASPRIVRSKPPK